jgi:hypothetical protein
MVKLDDLQREIEEILKYDPSQIVRASDLGSKLNFKDAQGVLRQLQLYFRGFTRDGLNLLADESIQKISMYIREVNKAIHRVHEFSSDQANAVAERQSILDALRQLWDTIKSELMAERALCLSSARDEEAHSKRVELLQKINQAIAQANSAAKKSAAQAEEFSHLVAQMKKMVEASEDESQRMLENIRQASLEAGVSKQAQYFKEEVDRLRVESIGWGIGTIFMAIVVVGTAWGSIIVGRWTAFAPTSDYEIIQLVLLRVILVGLAVYLLYICARSFMAAKHNIIVNRHRQNALQTYHALVDASTTTKDLVLAAAAQCIYSPQPTGLTANISSPMGMMPPLIKLPAAASHE